MKPDETLPGGECGLWIEADHFGEATVRLADRDGEPGAMIGSGDRTMVACDSP